MITRFVRTEEKEFERSEIDSMASNSINHIWNVLMNRRLAQHRDEARVLACEVLKNSPEIDELIAEKARHLLESGEVQFLYEKGSTYKSTMQQKKSEQLENMTNLAEGHRDDRTTQRSVGRIKIL